MTCSVICTTHIDGTPSGVICGLITAPHLLHHLSHSNQNAKYIFNKKYIWIIFCEKQSHDLKNAFTPSHESTVCSAAEQQRERTSFPNVAYALRRNRVVKTRMKRHACTLRLAGCTDGVALLRPDSGHVLTFNMIWRFREKWDRRCTNWRQTVMLRELHTHTQTCAKILTSPQTSVTVSW